MYYYAFCIIAAVDNAKPDGEAPSLLEGLAQSPLPMLVLVFVAAWFLLIRPARVRDRQQRDMLNNNLKKNDRVITNSGIIGTVANIKDEEVMLKLEEGRMRILKSTIARILGDESPGKESKEPAKNP